MSYPVQARLAQALPAFVAGLDLASDYEARGAGSAGTLLFLQELSSEIGVKPQPFKEIGKLIQRPRAPADRSQGLLEFPYRSDDQPHQTKCFVMVGLWAFLKCSTPLARVFGEYMGPRYRPVKAMQGHCPAR